MANKLYTEEQVNRALELLVETGKHNSKIIEQLTPIELPSDEEIDDRSLSEEHEREFRYGAKWLRDKILNQNNKQ